MDINRLHYFCTVTQTGSLTKASELLSISQPALSKALKTLEGELNEKLIIPSGRGIMVTDRGKQIAEYILPLIEKLQNLHDFKELDIFSNTIRIATFEVFSTYFLGKVIVDNFSEEKVQVFELLPGPMEDAIARGIADIGITYLPVPHPKLDILEVSSVKMGVFGIKNKFENIEFDALPFVVSNTTISGTPSKVKGLDGWPDHKLPRKCIYQITMMETALDLCRRGACVGYFPQFVVELHNQKVQEKYKLDKLELHSKLEPSKQKVYAIKRKSDIESSNFKKITRALRQLGK
jgi:DNA-binding transcriptional LysR family regulator